MTLSARAEESTMKPYPSIWTLALPVAMVTWPAMAADFAPKGAKAQLTVEYLYESVGRQADKVDSRDWRVRRGLKLAANLVAKAPAALSQANAPASQQMARIGQQQAQAQKMATQMAPMMAGAEQILARCGEDEKCIEREAMKMGAAMSGTRQLAETQKLGRETAAVMQPGALRYQLWQATAQQGSYEIDESLHIVHADPICMSLPKARCTRDEKRQGAGAAPGALPEAVKSGLGGGFALAEVDTGAGTITLRLPAALNLLPYTETITTDEPHGTHAVAPPRGPQRRLLDFHAAREFKPFTLPLKGGWRSQAGEQVQALKNDRGEAGKLTVRWRFAVL
jgi:hypothetical protein